MTFIRSATIKDVDKIAEFQQAMANETEGIFLNGDVLKAGIRAVLADPNKGEYFIAEWEGTVVGSLLITFEWSDWRNGQVLWIQSVFVEKEFRQKGIFTALYCTILDKAKLDPDISGVRLYVDETNHKAKEIYNRLGMNGDHYRVFEWMK